MRAPAALLVVLVLLATGVEAGARGERAGVRTLSFSGYAWEVKESAHRVGPGPNFFSGSTKNVWVDEQGRLHLRIARAKGKWWSAEVVNTQSLGYGTYTFTLDSQVHALDPNAVLGLFTWSDDPAWANRELDLEFARWGDPSDPTNGQYVVQPWDHPGNLVRITQPPGVTTSRHSIAWAPGSVAFASSSASPGSWTYAGPDVPVPGGEHARMNLWLAGGAAPRSGRPVEVILKSFAFAPAP